MGINKKVLSVGLPILLIFFGMRKGYNQITRLDSLLYMIEENRSDTILYQAYSGLFAYYLTVNRDSALHYLNKRIEIARRSGILSSLANSLTNRAFYYRMEGDYVKAFNDFNEALQIAERPFSKNSFWFHDSTYTADEGRIRILSEVHKSFAELYDEISNLNLAQYHYKKSAEYSVQLDSSYLWEENLTSALSRIYSSGDTRPCEDLYKLRDSYDPNTISPERNAILYIGLGKCNLKNDKTLAIKNFHKAAQFISGNYRNNLTLGIIYLDLSQVYAAIGQADSSLIFARKGFIELKGVKRIGLFNYDAFQAYKCLSAAFAINNQMDSANYYNEIAFRSLDSLNKSKIEHLISFQNLSADQRLEIQQLTSDAQAYKIKIRLIILSGVLALFLIGGYFFSRQYRQMKLSKLNLEKAIANLQKAQSQLIQSEKMASLGELTAGIAHEIQNPLNFVNNFSEVSLELVDETLEELNGKSIDAAKSILNDMQQNLQKISHHGRRASDIVRSMLQHSRTNSGRRELTDINALCDEYLRLAYHGMRTKDKSFNVKYLTDFDQSLPKIEVIPQDIGRVLLNLINNGFQAIADLDKPQLTVKTVEAPSLKEGGGVQRGILITVSDNGPGIPASIKDKIFQPFFTTKPTGQGTGLGLSLSYDIVKAHGGELSVLSAEGEGAEFLVRLPID